MKSCVLAALLQFGIGKACDSSDWKACPSFNGDLQSCIQQDCCLWSNHDETCVTSFGPYKCPVEYFHHCSSLMPDCDSSEDTCGACSGDAMCSWRHEAASDTSSGYLWACSPTAHTSHHDPATGKTFYECDDAPPHTRSTGPAPAPVGEEFAGVDDALQNTTTASRCPFWLEFCQNTTTASRWPWWPVHEDRRRRTYSDRRRHPDHDRRRSIRRQGSSDRLADVPDDEPEFATASVQIANSTAGEELVEAEDELNNTTVASQWPWWPVHEDRRRRTHSDRRRHPDHDRRRSIRRRGDDEPEFATADVQIANSTCKADGDILSSHFYDTPTTRQRESCCSGCFLWRPFVVHHYYCGNCTIFNGTETCYECCGTECDAADVVVV